jgi:hypothetical protein
MRQPETFDDLELVLFYYGESERADEIRAALESTPGLEPRYAELRRVLDAVEVPEAPQRGDLYGHEVWRRVYPRLDGSVRPAAGPGRSGQLRRVAGWAIAATLLVALSFWAGRESAGPAPETLTRSELDSDRILLVEVAGHLERSQFLLLELTHSGAASLDGERLEAVRRLKADSRLYRGAAQAGGQTDLAFVLGELEVFLTELAHLGPDATSDVEALLDRVDRSNLIFKVRVLESRIEQRTRPAGGTPTA